MLIVHIRHLLLELRNTDTSLLHQQMAILLIYTHSINHHQPFFPHPHQDIPIQVHILHIHKQLHRSPRTSNQDVIHPIRILFISVCSVRHNSKNLKTSPALETREIPYLQNGERFTFACSNRLGIRSLSVFMF